MRLKTPLCQVMCLVITVSLRSATAQYDAISIETLVTDAMQTFEQKIMEKLHAQHKEVIEKVVESFNQLRNISENLLAGQSEIQKQLTNLTNDLHHNRSHVDQENANDNEFHMRQNSNNVQQKKVKEKLDAHATNVQQLAESIENLRNITDHHVASLSDVGKELTTESIEQGNQSSVDMIPSSCTTVNINKTGTYFIRPAGVVEPFRVLCDFEDNFELGGGWTVFQRRINGAVDFNQNWTMYKNGFGDVNGEHWLGLEKLHVMTRSGSHEMLVLLEDHEGGSAYALYKDFKVGSEEEMYKLTVGSYSGTAGDSLNYHNEMKFTTIDQDNDKKEDHNCAKYFNGGWWFTNCVHSILNGEYLKTGEHLTLGVSWYHWKGWEYSLKSTKMMLRRRSG